MCKHIYVCVFVYSHSSVARLFCHPLIFSFVLGVEGFLSSWMMEMKDSTEKRGGKVNKTWGEREQDG